jgi:hypothetical protein
MKEFVSLAKQAEADYQGRIVRLQYEEECAVDIDGVHYHLVLISSSHLMDWGCKNDTLISEAVSTVGRHNYEPLHEEAYTTALKVLKTVSSSGQWIGPTVYGGLVWWERSALEVLSKGSFGRVEGMRLSKFLESGGGMVFMMKSLACDYRSAASSI